MLTGACVWRVACEAREDRAVRQLRAGDGTYALTDM